MIGWWNTILGDGRTVYFILTMAVILGVVVGVNGFYAINTLSKNNQLLIEQAKQLTNSSHYDQLQLQNVSHADQLQREVEHNHIINNVTELLEQQQKQSDNNVKLLKYITGNQTKEIIKKLNRHLNETAENLNLTIINHKILKNTNDILHQYLPVLANLTNDEKKLDRLLELLAPVVAR